MAETTDSVETELLMRLVRRGAPPDMQGWLVGSGWLREIAEHTSVLRNKNTELAKECTRLKRRVAILKSEKDDLIAEVEGR